METFILILGVLAMVATLLAAYFLGKAEKYRKHNYTCIANDYYTACFACVGFILLFFLIAILSLTMQPADKRLRVDSPCLDEPRKELNLPK